jgi:pyrroline-5-carboxylate reductase
MKLGFIGTGVISEACIRGLFASELTIEQVCVSRRSHALSAKLAVDFSNVQVLDDNQMIIDQSDVIVLAVRPQIAEEVLAGLQIPLNKVVISLIATLTHTTLQQWFGQDVNLCRAIPLPFVAQRLGVTAIYPRQQTAETLFNAIGTVITAETEDEFDRYAVASATMGIYFESLATLSEWMTNEGTPQESAQRYFAALFKGLNHTALNHTEQPFADQVPEHCTPGGLNEQAVNVFTQQGGKDALIAALDSLKARLQGAK